MGRIVSYSDGRYASVASFQPTLRSPPYLHCRTREESRVLLEKSPSPPLLLLALLLATFAVPWGIFPARGILPALLVALVEEEEGREECYVKEETPDEADSSPPAEVHDSREVREHYDG